MSAIWRSVKTRTSSGHPSNYSWGKRRNGKLAEYFTFPIWLRYQPRRRNAGPASWISLTLDQLASWQSASYAQIPALALIASWNTGLKVSPFVPASNLLLCSISLLFWQTEIAPLMLAMSSHLRKVSTTTWNSNGCLRHWIKARQKKRPPATIQI